MNTASKSKTRPLSYYFADAPQFGTTITRQWCADYLRACRKSGRFIAKRIRPGYIEVRALVAWNSSTVAVIASY
jgi:hypothetical protein